MNKEISVEFPIVVSIEILVEKWMDHEHKSRGSNFLGTTWEHILLALSDDALFAELYQR